MLAHNLNAIRVKSKATTECNSLYGRPSRRLPLFIDALAVENHNHTLEHYDQDCAMTGTPTSQTGIAMILYLL
ncbi:hypothetical protein RvY_11048 [Ramazzottius varieornatus]|uniref:Uncharacterized protein n=1 Tax=Ramazzottius varieornatus TaxID=947166 RepID=A0A1D1VGW0_RAMVA|nr:hypothetical protein RvY_11048 [Ramazzottius varieornatus]